MPWVRLSDDFYDHPKFDRAGTLGIALFTAGLAWANRNLTDGFIPRKAALRLLDFEDVVEAVRNADRNGVTNALHNDDLTPAITRGAVQSLVDAGLWHVEEGGYRIHDYLDYQASKEQIEASRQSNAARQKLWRERKKAEKQAQNEAQSNADRNAVTNGTVTGAPNPNPKKEVLRTSLGGDATPDTDLFGEPVEDTKPKPKKRSKPATPAPEYEDFVITDTMRAWAKKNVPNLDLDHETKKFLARHAAKGNTFKDWSQAWRTWMLNALDYAQERGQHLRAVPGGPAPTAPKRSIRNEWMNRQ